MNLQLNFKLICILISLPWQFAVAQVDAPNSNEAALSPAQEKVYADLITELRCLVCANQSLADSNSGLAGDLRARVREMLRAGQGRAEITDYMVGKYGEYVLYRPRFSAANWFLWLAPFLAVIGGLIFVRRLAAKRAAAEQPPYSAAQLQHADTLLRG